MLFIVMLSILFCTDSEDSDVYIDRLDYTLFSQQSLMEMLVQHVKKRVPSWGRKEAPTEIKCWKGVELNDKNEVFYIEWKYKGHPLGGSLSFQWLPSTLLAIDLLSNNLNGSINLSTFPKGMKSIIIRENNFNTSVDLTALPEPLVELGLQNNKLLGTLNLTELPQTLNDLNLSTNKFIGTVCLSKLPERLEILSLHNNYYLEGAIDAKILPRNLMTMSIGRTRITGSVRRCDLPKSVECFTFTCSNVDYEGEIIRKRYAPVFSRRYWDDGWEN